MPVTVMSLHEPAAGPDELIEKLKPVVPSGASASVHALTSHFLRIAIVDGGAHLTTETDLTDGPPAPWIATIAIDPDDPTPERTADDYLNAIETHTVSSAALEPRLHLDLTTASRQPGAHAFIMNRRQPLMTRDEFYWYYRTNHTSLARQLEPAFIRYATHRVLHSRGPHFADGMTVQEYDDLASFERHIATRTRTDDTAFLDIANFVGVVDYWVGEQAQSF